MYQTLNEEMWWILSIKTTGATQGMVVAVPDGMGLEAFPKISSYYQHMNQASVHELRIKVMNPATSTEEAEVAEKIESWQADVMRLKRIDKATDIFAGPILLVGLTSDTVRKNKGERGSHVLVQEGTGNAGCSRNREEILEFAKDLPHLSQKE